MYVKAPTHYITNGGKRFGVRVTKFNKRTLVVQLVRPDGTVEKSGVKVKKTSHKLIYP